MRLISVEKVWKHILMQKVVTLNTYCNVACLIFQLPHITTGSFQSHRRQSTTGCLQSHNVWKNTTNIQSDEKVCFAIHKLVWWYFQVGWPSGLQFVFFWDNVNNLKYAWIILLKRTFWTSQGKVATSDRWDGQFWKIFMSHFLRFSVPKIIKID